MLSTARRRRMSARQSHSYRVERQRLDTQEQVLASIDLGGTKIAGALALADGRLLAQQTVATQSHEGPAAVLGRIATLVSDLARQAGSRPVALGMGVPGLVDVRHGITRFFPNLPTHWRDVPAAEMLSAQTRCPVYLLNDVRLATLGELTYGHGRTAQTMAFFALGTGIGGGIVVDGQLRLGPLGAAGELGHQTILPDGPRCGCGNLGCLEALASGPAIAAEGVRLLLSGQAHGLYALVAGDCGAVTPKAMAAAAAAGDEAVRGALLRAAEYLGIGVANIVTSLHPDLVVLGGGVAEIGPLLFDTVRDVVRRRVRMFPPDDVRIEPSLLGEKAGLLGGVTLAARGGL
jgi:glucokinase